MTEKLSFWISIYMYLTLRCILQIHFVCSKKQWHLPTPPLQKDFNSKSRDHYVHHEVSGSHHERREMIPGFAWPSITKQVVCKIKVYVLETHHGGHLLETCGSWWCPSKISPIMFFWQKYLHEEAKSQEQRWEAVKILKLMSNNTFMPEGGCKCFFMSYPPTGCEGPTLPPSY